MNKQSSSELLNSLHLSACVLLLPRGFSMTLPVPVRPLSGLVLFSHLMTEDNNTKKRASSFQQSPIWFFQEHCCLPAPLPKSQQLNSTSWLRVVSIYFPTSEEKLRLFLLHVWASFPSVLFPHLWLPAELFIPLPPSPVCSNYPVEFTRGRERERESANIKKRLLVGFQNKTLISGFLLPFIFYLFISNFIFYFYQLLILILLLYLSP